MKKQTLINEYPGIISDIQYEIKNLENEVRVLNKLYVILDILHGVPVPEIVDKHKVSQGSVYNWVKRWNESGINGLKRKEGSKGKSKLTDEQFKELDKLIQEKNLKTAKQVHNAIVNEFEVEYSIRQIERIMKDLGYSYTKPYKIYDKMPEDAKEQLKKN